jgi:hypothetical protein
MLLSCPACQAEMSLDVLLSREADARQVAAFLLRHVPIGDALVRYVALFRPAKRRLSIARVVSLLEELLPDLERGAIARKGRDWTCGHDVWKAGLDAVLAKRDNGTLTLPLTSHGLLYEVMASLADKAESKAEAQAEADRKQRRSYGAGEQLVPAAAAAQNVLSPTAPAAPMPDYSRPSRAALALKAQMQAKLQSKQTPPTPEGETP